MAFVPVPNTAEMKLNFTVGNQQVQVGIDWEKAGPWTDAELLQLANSAMNGWHTTLRNRLSNGLLLRNIVCRSLESQSAPAVELPVSVNNTGSNPQPPTANNVTMAIKKLTQLRGRSFRGRIFMPGLPANMVNSPTTFDQGATNDIVSDWRNFVTAIDTDNAAFPVVVSRYSGKDGFGRPLPRPVGVTTPITGFAADAVIDSQRRRLGGRGR